MTLAVDLILIVLLVIPVTLLVWCAATEAALMKNRPQLSWLLPAGTMLAASWTRRGWAGSSGAETLFWTLPALYGRCALAGTAGGAAIGAVLRWFGVPVGVRSESHG